MNISVIGAGAFGTALACQLAKAGNNVKIWAFEKEVEEEINSKHQNSNYLPAIKINPKVRATNDLNQTWQHANIIFLAPPFFALRSILPEEVNNKILVCASKGIERKTHLLASEIIASGVKGKYEVAILSGPSFAKEVAQGKKTKVTITSQNQKSAERVKKCIETQDFKAELSTDIIGVQLCGALKNVMAILAGITKGLGSGQNLQAAFFVEGLKEMARLGEKMGAQKESFTTVSGLGDLFLTGTSDESRNYKFGLRLAKGEKVEEMLSGKNVVEGIGSADSAYHLCKKYKLNSPLFYNVYKSIFEGKNPKLALADIWKSL